MFDSLPDSEGRADEWSSRDRDNAFRNPGRWAHFPAGLVFCLLYFPLKSHTWSVQLAVAAAYTVYVFWFAIGSGLKDMDDLFGDPQVATFIGKLLLPHILILTLIVPGVWLWLHLLPMLPAELTHEGRKESLWDLFGWILLGAAAITQGFWMEGKIKKFREAEE